ncbi:MAG TPA: FeoB-associated Cys-rich membrane protein [Defluviitaleaceae bacterium]|nr:FeoB-associated Cys-rich membrane protein [Defluviitaleaceae bacterium]HPT75639.1 FeoB-associated Cys-rich membrane protein [Defluviitaleaceae bacterium]HQD51464.1 FeoB-associated Cys-rich membrane protein [Defluviitaleaceae bacterium]
MIKFLINNLSTIIISVILLLIVASIIYKQIANRKKGKTSCGCGCSACSAYSLCHPESEKSK